MDVYSLIDELNNESHLEISQWEYLFDNSTPETAEYAGKLARIAAEEAYGKRVFIRGLIEFSGFCKNNCYYCGLRCGNVDAQRYRLSKADILACAENGYRLGFRTFVLQSGEDSYYTDEILCDLIHTLKISYPDCAITLSIGERSGESFRKLFDAGASRYLLRHETADRFHYENLHPDNMSFDHRINCLYEMKKIGYRVGCGFMVDSPGQTSQTLAKDMHFIEALQPSMVGIGPFIPHNRTPFSKEKPGSVQKTLYLISLLRLLKKNLLIPATTALATMDPKGREKGILAGANVVMPNLSPENVREKYEIYDHKVISGEEAAEGIEDLRKRFRAIGYEIPVDRGDPIESHCDK